MHDHQLISDRSDRDRVDRERAFRYTSDLFKECAYSCQADIVALKLRQTWIEEMKDDIARENFC